MSFLKNLFVHDVFVSYAHADVDNEGTSDIKDWCQDFANNIRSKLKMFPDFKDISFYLDESERQGERLSATSEISSTLEEAASKSALLLAMMSPWYLKSEWCKKERTWWQIGANNETMEWCRNFDRTFIAQVMETDDSNWPDIFKDIKGISKKGFLLFDKLKPEFKRFPLGMIGTDEDKSAYNSSLVDIVGEIASTLDEIKKHLECERMKQDSNKLLEADGQVIYLHSRPELTDQFKIASKNLSSAGYIICPEQPTPLSNDGRLDDNQKDDLASSDAVMILGVDNRLGHDIITVGRNNRQLVKSISKKRLPCAVFDVIGKRNHHVSRIDNARNLKIAWIDTTETNWKNQIRNWLQNSSNSEG